MNLAMFEIIGTNTEGLTTDRANVGFLSCVKSRVNLQNEQNEMNGKRQFNESWTFQHKREEKIERFIANNLVWISHIP